MTEYFVRYNRVLLYFINEIMPLQKKCFVTTVLAFTNKKVEVGALGGQEKTLL